MRSKESSRILFLDFLRSLAVMLVLGRHIFDIPKQPQGDVTYYFLMWRQVGWIGVDLFFVLSGYLVSGLLFREFQSYGSISPISFMIRRGLRIYPAFLVFILLSPLIAFFCDSAPVPSIGLIINELFFVQNYLGGVWYHTWSLGVEEHFYLLLLLFVLASTDITRSQSDDPFRHLPRITLWVGVTLLFCRIARGWPGTTSWGMTLTFTHYRLDSLLFGVLLSYYSHFKPVAVQTILRQWDVWLGVGGSVLVSSAFFVPIDNPFMPTFGFTLLYLGFGAWVMVAAHSKLALHRSVALLLMPLCFIGRHSYSIYLWHLPLYFWRNDILWLFTGSADHSFLVATLTYLGASIPVGVGMSMLIEQPMLGYRDKLVPARR